LAPIIRVGQTSLQLLDAYVIKLYTRRRGRATADKVLVAVGGGLVEYLEAGVIYFIR